MELTEKQIEMIRYDLTQRGITLKDLSDSLVDHICCALEEEQESDFDTAWPQVIACFGPESFQEIELLTIYQLTLKNLNAMKKLMYLFLYFAVILFTTGLLFKLQHWPFASIMLILSVLLFNFGFLPIFFYGKYKAAIS